jgi:hypothetical protein
VRDRGKRHEKSKLEGIACVWVEGIGLNALPELPIGVTLSLPPVLIIVLPHTRGVE